MNRAYLYIATAILILFSHSIFAGQFDHAVYDSLLNENTNDGLVDYSSINEDPSQLIRYLQQLENLDSLEYSGWSEQGKTAFWINAYNAITIYGVILNYPIKAGGLISLLIFPNNSIRQISRFWKTSFSRVMGKEITLDEIEHEILRKEFDEPRIHFALVCASIGCPKLQSYAYDSDSLDIQLDRVTREFIRSKGAIIDKKNNRLYVSRIFDWYNDDFRSSDIPEDIMSYDKNKRGFIKFIIDHSDGDVEKFILEDAPDIKFSKYNWSLNELKR